MAATSVAIEMNRSSRSDGDRFDRWGTRLRAWAFSRFSTVETISGDAASRFRERRMLVRIWVRASDMVQAAFLSVEEEAVVAAPMPALACRSAQS